MNEHNCVQLLQQIRSTYTHCTFLHGSLMEFDGLEFAEHCLALKNHITACTQHLAGFYRISNFSKIQKINKQTHDLAMAWCRLTIYACLYRSSDATP